MKVLHYISGIFPDIGGIERFVLNIAATGGFEVSVLTRYVDVKSQSYKAMLDLGIEVYSLDINHLNFNSFSEYKKKISAVMKEKAKDCDILHIHSIEEPYIAHIAKVSGFRKIVVHVHSKIGRGGIVLKSLKKLDVLLNCRYSECFFACSQKIAQEVYPRSVRDKAMVIKNGIDTSHYIFNEIERNSIRELYDLTDITLCHIGRFVKVKNQSFVVDVFYEVLKKRPRAKLLLIGDGSDKEGIQNKCAELGLTDSAIFIGGVQM